MKKVFLLIATLLSTISFNHAFAAFGIGASPSNVEMVISPGNIYRQKITIANMALDKPIALKVNKADFDFDNNNNLLVREPGSLENSASNWVNYAPNNFVLQPKSNTQLNVEFTIPAKIDGPQSRRSALIISPILPPEEERRKYKGIWNNFQIVIIFYLTTKESEAKIDINLEKVKLTPGNVNFNLEIRNTGNAHARLKGDFIIEDASGKIIAKKEFNNVILEKREKNIKTNFKLDNITAGQKYKLKTKLVNTFNPKNQLQDIEIKDQEIEVIAEKLTEKSEEKMLKK